MIESALRPVASKNTAVRFLKVHYDEIDFNRAGVPAILAYRNHGDLFANLTGLAEIIPRDEVSAGYLESLFRAYEIM